MLLHYLKYSPTGNITVLVTTPVPRPEQPGVASRLLEVVGGEQVGFIEPAADPRCPARLQMMGGEFCGNATMSLGAMLARERALSGGEALDLLLEVSGLDAPVSCRIQNDGDRHWTPSSKSLPPCGASSARKNVQWTFFSGSSVLENSPVESFKWFERLGKLSSGEFSARTGRQTPVERVGRPPSMGPAGPRVVDLPENACIVSGETDEVPVPCRIACPVDRQTAVGTALRRPLADDRSPVAAPSTAPSDTLPSSPLLGTVQMPLPLSIGEITLPADAGPLTLPVVTLPGITHLILPADAAPDETELRRRMPDWNRTIGADALGALRFDAAGPSIDPLVYVPSVGTLVREHGCGSGTAAVGCHLAMAAGHTIQAPIAQPGGTIAVSATLRDGRITALAITGRVALLEEGDVEI